MEGEMSYSMQNGGGIVLGNMSVREVFRSRISSLNAGADPRKGRGARASPKAPVTFFYKRNTTSLCTILQVHGHCGNDLFKSSSSSSSRKKSLYTAP